MFKDQGCSRVFFVVVLDPPVSYDGTLKIPTSRLRTAATHTFDITDVEYADDSLLYECNWDRFVLSANLLNDSLISFGASFNAAKSEWLELPGHADPAARDATPLPGTRILYIDGPSWYS